MTQEKAIKLLPLTEDELGALRIFVGAVTNKEAIANMNLDKLGLVLWEHVLLPSLQSIAEKIKS